MAKIQVPNDFGPAGALEWFSNWRGVANEPELEITFSDTASFDDAHSLVRPAVLALIASSVAARGARGLLTTVNPVGARVHPLTFAIAGLVKLGRGGAGLAYGLPDKPTYTLRQISTMRDAHELAEKAGNGLELQAPDLSPSVVRMARFVFEELGANVVQHSLAPSTGFGLVHADPTARRFDLAFADCGVGFLTSLQRNPELKGRLHDDAEALQVAINPRITGASNPRTNMGVGLKLLTDFSDLLGGDLWIASGSALLQRRSTAGQRTNVIRSIPEWRGAWICIEAPI